MFKTILFAAATCLFACGTDSTDSTAQNSGAASCPSSGAACTADADCPANEECEDGACKAHGGDDCVEDDGVDDDGVDDGADDNGEDPQGGECTVDTDCGSGLECEDGLCKPHGGD